MRQLMVSYTNGCYPIYIAKHLLRNSEICMRHLASGQVVVISQAPISQHYLSSLKASLTGKTILTIDIPVGEEIKQWQTVEGIVRQLVDNQCRRDMTMIALGGGVVGDIAGFVASIYQRGINLIQIPTTLLAQVDSSIGGKTAINFNSHKNLLGSYYHPSAVIIDPSTLQSLPVRELRSGFAEMLKIGLVCDATYFTWLEQHINKLIALDEDIICQAICRACQLKADIVKQDEKETQGLRFLLNFGHTFAHAIESITEYKRFLHGEAVAVGMMLALKYSQHLCQLNPDITQRVCTLLQRMDLPTQLPNDISQQQLMTAMQVDKKHTHQILRLVLLEQLGRGVVKEVEQLQTNRCLAPIG